jgi:hypothetical protein
MESSSTGDRRSGDLAAVNGHTVNAGQRRNAVVFMAKLEAPDHSDGRGSLRYAAVSKSCLSNPSLTIHICFGGYSRR